MFLWIFGLLIIHSMESMATPSTSNEREYNNTISMMCVRDRSFVSNDNPKSGYFYINIGEGQAIDYDWKLTLGTDRKVIFYVQGYGEDMHPEGENYVEGEGKVDSFARVAQSFLFDRRSIICLFEFKHKKNLGFFGSILDLKHTAMNRVPFVAKILKELASEMHKQKVFSTFEDFEFIGFSLGAHIVGTTARIIKTELGHEIPRIFALEPAKTPIRNFPYQLRRSDARYIQAIYTSSLSNPDLDLHCKVFVNDGANQEGCGGKYLTERILCNHCYLVGLYDHIAMRTTLLIGYMDPDRNGANYTTGKNVLVGHQYQDFSTGIYYANTDGSKLKKKWLG